MQNHSDAQLLRQYAGQRAEIAFGEIVARHAGLVYAAALRQLESPDLARDVAQSVFTDLARKAPSLVDKLSADASLAGWLYRSTRFAARDLVRDDRRRQRRERQAMQHFDVTTESTPEWERVRPVLDEAMAELSEEDREAVLLRYFEKQDLLGVGRALGVSDDAAQKRVSRALERLRTGLTSRGVTTTTGALSTLLVAETVSFAPAGLAATLSTAAIAGTTLTATFTATKAIAMTTLQKTLIGATLAAGMATPLVIQHQSQTLLRAENQTLREQIAELSESATRSVATSPPASTNSAPALANEQFNELLRLRGEVARLRRDSQELAQLKAGKAQTSSDPVSTELNPVLARVNELKQMLNQKPDLKIPELQFLTPQDWLNVAAGAKLDTDSGVRQALSRLRSASKLVFSPMLQEALTKYVQASGGQLPTEVSQLKPYFGAPVDDALLDRYQLLRTGKASDVPAPEPGIVAQKVEGTERTAIKFRPPTSEGSIIAEKAKVDADFDSVLSFGLNGSHLSEQGPIGSGLDAVTRSTILGRGITRPNK